jgi:Amiloride-sensitive sodium channel
MSDSLAATTTLQDSLDYLVAGSDGSLKLQMGHQLTETFKACSFDSIPCDMLRDIKPRTDSEMGTCFTFNFNDFYRTRRAGAKHGKLRRTRARSPALTVESSGATILLEVMQSEYICSTVDAGFKVLVHPPSQYPFAQTQGVKVAPGTYTALSLSQVRGGSKQISSLRTRRHNSRR